MKSITVYLVACVAAVFCLNMTACGDDDDGAGPIVGEWEDEEEHYNWRDVFEIESDLKGEGEFWLFYDADNDTLVYCEYDLEVEKDGDKYIIDAECDDSSDFDFEMECELDGPDELDCEGTDGYMDDWEWTFEKD